VERARLVARHLRRAPPLAVGDLHLGNHRRAVADQPGLNRERGAGLDAGVAGRDVEGDPLGKERQRRGVGRLAGRPARQEQGDAEREEGRRGLEAGAPQRLGRHDGVDVDVGGPPRGVADHLRRKRRRVVRLRDVDRRNQAVVERGRALLDVARDLAVGGHAPQRHEAPRHRSRRQDQRGTGQQHQHDRRANRPARRQQGDEDHRRRVERRANHRMQGRQRPPPAPHAGQEVVNGFVMLHKASRTVLGSGF
jgi:hypothetical protein